MSPRKPTSTPSVEVASKPPQQEINVQQLNEATWAAGLATDTVLIVPLYREPDVSAFDLALHEWLDAAHARTIPPGSQLRLLVPEEE